MAKVDSIDKIVTSYFAAVCAEPFEYKGRRYEVPKLTISPHLLRGFTCPEGCGGCCPRFSLDYIPGEELPYEMGTRSVFLNGLEVLVYSDTQDNVTTHHCANLRTDNGRCGIHGRQPFSCDFELIRFLHYADTGEVRGLTKLFGRGHAMLRVDGVRGALCQLTPVDAATTADTVRKLKRLAQWCEHFGVAHRVGYIVEWALGNPQHPLVLPSPTTAKKGFHELS